MPLRQFLSNCTLIAEGLNIIPNFVDILHFNQITKSKLNRYILLKETKYGS